MISYQDVPYVISAVVLIVGMGLVIKYILSVSSKKIEDAKFARQVHYARDGEDIPYDDELTEKSKLDEFVEMLLKNNIFNPRENDAAQVKRKLLLGYAVSFALSLILLENVFISLFPGLMVLVILYVRALIAQQRRQDTITAQIPSFVSTIKANIQADQHIANAMMGAINNTAAPLYDELEYSRAIMEAGDFNAGIVSLRRNAENDTLRQLCTCIEIANSVGANMEEQIEIIEDIIDDKKKLEREKKLGVNQNKSLIYAAVVFVPVSFFGSYAMSEMHRDYWFKSLTSIIILIGLITMVAIGAWSAWREVEDIDVN